MIIFTTGPEQSIMHPPKKELLTDFLRDPEPHISAQHQPDLRVQRGKGAEHNQNYR